MSAYFNTFRDSIVQISHCPDNYVPGLLQDVELYDVAGLVAPRALFVESGTDDLIFPVDAATQTVAALRQVYEHVGAADAIEHHLFAGEHQWCGEGVEYFMQHWLGAP